MKLSEQPRLMILLILVLLVSNITTVATIIYLQDHSHKSIEELEKGKSASADMPRGMFFKEQLKLTDEQHDVFRDFHQYYNRTTRGVTADLDQKRLQMVDELGSENSDTIVLAKLAVEIGALHQELKEYTIDYYLEMKQACTDEQKVVLHQLFNNLLNKDGNVQLPAQGGQHRWGQKRNNNN